MSTYIGKSTMSTKVSQCVRREEYVHTVRVRLVVAAGTSNTNLAKPF